MKSKIKELLPFEGKGTILLGYRGSISHGTYIPSKIDDKDVLGIVIPPQEYMYGLKHYEQTERFKEDIDLVVYEIRKYIRLLSKNNPNVMSLLWLNEQHYIHKDELGQRLIDNRDMFISKLCYKTYGGYAVSQFRKMTKFEFKGYMGEKRKKLVEEFGYDTKNAAHLLRLLKMGIEVLTSGEVNVLREDSQLYISIKQGEWTLKKVKEESERLFKLLDEAYVRSKLPARPDFEKINKLCVEIVKDYYERGEI